jgi:protease-4
MPAHHIVAEPATLTGSIGVVSVKLVIDGTLDKLGMNIEEVTTGKYAGMYSATRPFTPEERKKVLDHMQATYTTFVEKAAAGRRMKPEQIDAIGQGRVWTGNQAKDLGLVDELGGFEHALAAAKSRAKIDPQSQVELVIYPQKKSIYELMQFPFGGASAGILNTVLGQHTARAVESLGAPLRLFRRGEPLTLMPNIFVR